MQSRTDDTGVRLASRAAASADEAASPEGRRMGARLVVLLLSMLMGMQIVTTELYVPALPDLTRHLDALPSQAQLTLTVMLLAFGVSQLAWGPLSDRFGRRPILILGLAVHTLASIGCVLAPTIAALITWRGVQGAAMGAAAMCVRAVVRDLHAPEQGARVMSLVFIWLGVVACVAAPLGGVLADHLGWRWTLGAVALFSACALALVCLRFLESLPHQRRAPLSVASLMRTCASVVAHPTFRASAALTMATYGGQFTFLATSSFVFQQVLGLTRTEFGLAIAATALVYIGGTLLSRRMLPRMGVRRVVAWAGGATLVAGTTMGVLALAGVHSPWAILLPHCLYMGAHGTHQSCGQSGCVAPFPRAAGMASAVNGFLMMLTAFCIGGWIGWRMDGSIFVLVNGVWFWSACVAAVAWTLIQRDGERARP